MRLFLSLCLIASLSLLAACGGGGDNAISAESQPSDTDPANFARVEVGMTKDQVEGLLGQPHEYIPQGEGEIGMWTQQDTTRFQVFFNEAGSVVSINQPPPGLEY